MLLQLYAVARTEHEALVKSTTKIFSNFVAFSENPNFNIKFFMWNKIDILVLDFNCALDYFEPL